MKMIIVLGVLAIVFTSCGTLVSPETQYERERLIEAYDAARQKHNPERVKEAVKDLLVGKWQYVGLEVEEGNVSAQQVRPMSQQTIDASTSSAPVASEGTTSEQAIASNASEQTDAQNPPNIEAEGQTPEANATRLPPIEVEDKESNQRILNAKAALVASTRKNLTIEFSEDRGSYHYSGSNRGTNVTGQCSITTKRYGDDPLPFISFNRRTGPEMLEFLFGSEPIKQMVAKKKQADAERIRRMGAQIGRRASAKASFTIASIAGITVTEDTLYLVLYGDMELTPKGWMRTGGLRCTFKRIE
ncbi:hypothetical protein C6500_08485 [Candidatus Poribacteria bacterium]|nr:MAG: hypothetical protein C6500_08485 [Candidatus Poribacteria bacterium]